MAHLRRAPSLAFLLLAAAGSSAAAGAAPPPVRVEVEPPRPSPGDRIRFRFVPQDPAVRVVAAHFDRLALTLHPVPGGGWVADAAIGRREPPGPRELEIRYRDGQGREGVSYPVVEVPGRRWSRQALEVRPELADPPEAERRRALAEASTADPAPRLRRTRSLVLPWQAPVPGPVTAPFGVERTLNGVGTDIHLGIDFRAARGTPVCAPAAGRVMAVTDELFGGTTVRLDHGDGWVSWLMHLDRVTVRPGDRLGAGSPVGTSGATGRVTAPHLHFAVAWRGRHVDPRQLVTPPPDRTADASPPDEPGGGT